MTAEPVDFIADSTSTEGYLVLPGLCWVEKQHMVPLAGGSEMKAPTRRMRRSHSSAIKSATATTPIHGCFVEAPDPHDIGHAIDRETVSGVARTLSSQSKTTWCGLDITPSWQAPRPLRDGRESIWLVALRKLRRLGSKCCEVGCGHRV